MLRLFILQPTVIFEARVNQDSFAYPLTELEFDGVTTGAFGDIEPGMTVLFGSAAGDDDYGRQRIRLAADSDTIFIGRSSQGTRDGEADLVDNAYITVLSDYRVWAKAPYIDGSGESFKDEIDWSDETTDNPPVANAGAAVFATIDGGSIITVDFDSADSFVVADGAAISTYLWDVDDGTITVGTSASSSITATFPAGFRWVSLTITDDNSKTHTTRVPVFARDPASDDTIDNWQIRNHTIAPEGQRLTIRVLASIAEGTYPDGTLVMIADGEPASASDRTNLHFVGWHMTDPADIGAERTGLMHSTDLSLADVAGKLDTLPTYPSSIEKANTPDKWQQMETPNIDKFLHYILQWHSTALDVADFTNSGTGSAMQFVILGTEGQSLFDSVARKCRAIVPDYHLTCNTLGQLQVVSDPMLQDSGDRTATIQATLAEDDWTDLSWTHIRYPRTHWLTAWAVLAGYWDPDVEDATAIKALAPGHTPGQGENEVEHSEQLAETQADLNSCTGHRYARLNAPESSFRIILAEGDDLDIEPADMTWVKLTISAANAAQRGLAFTEERGLPLKLNIRYNHARTGLTRTVELLWEREISGPAAITQIVLVDPQTPEEDWWDEPNWEVPTGPVFYDPPAAYIVWDQNNVGRSLDIMAATPTWALVDTGLTGSILNCQYVGITATSKIGVWCLTTTGVWWCGDIMAGTPSWTNTYALATMQAAETAPDSGSARFVGMANHGARPGYLIITTEPDTADTANADWEHGYFHRTSDYGANWTVEDVADDGLVYDQGGHIRGYMYCSVNGMEWYRDDPGRIYSFRMTPRVITNSRRGILYSDDDGATWAVGELFPAASNNWQIAGLLHPFPNSTDPLWVINGSTGVSARPELHKSVDGGVNIDTLSDPSGYDGFITGLRPNSAYNEPLHVMAWARNTADTDADLLDSDDGGTTWNVLWDSGASENWTTPNGWPTNRNIWFIVRKATGGATLVSRTEDYFATTPVDISGNLSTVFSTWNGAHTRGTADGFALPRIGDNA